ncbi:MAG: hypothetical protein HGB02_03725 [Chlorobiaceae bacterium]|nr:hypothetical protein [Chlorobiaceae bacterium]
MNAKLKGSDIVAIGGVIDPQSNAASATKTTDYVDMSLFEGAMAIINVGAITSTGKVDAKIVQATASDGTNKKDVSDKAITQLTEAGSGSNKQAIINVFAEELDINNGFRYVAVEITNTTAAAIVSVNVLGISAKYNPASDNDVASVAEIV